MIKTIVHKFKQKLKSLFGKTFYILIHSWEFFLAMIQAPLGVMEVYDEHLRLESFDYQGYSFFFARIPNGAVYTNRKDNVSFLYKKMLLPHVSWQYINGRVVSDQENLLLSRAILLKKLPIYFDCTVISLLTGGGGNYNYYHWLFDCLPRLHLIELQTPLNALSEDIKFFIPEDTLPFQRETLDLMGIPAESCISSKDITYLKAKELITVSHPNLAPVSDWIVTFLRNRLLPFSSQREFNPFVYISRNDSSNNRRLLNENDFFYSLSSLGFSFYELSKLKVVDQIALFAHARIIISVHGAGLANLAFCSEGAIVYELFSEKYQPDMYQKIACISNLTYYKVVCESIDRDGLPPNKANLFISNARLEQIMDSIRKSMKA